MSKPTEEHHLRDLGIDRPEKGRFHFDGSDGIFSNYRISVSEV